MGVWDAFSFSSDVSPASVSGIVTKWAQPLTDRALSDDSFPMDGGSDEMAVLDNVKFSSAVSPERVSGKLTNLLQFHNSNSLREESRPIEGGSDSIDD